MAILCSLKNLTLSFSSKELFSQASVTIHLGEHIGLLGLNGQGKTSLFKILTGDQRADISTPPFIFDKAKGMSDREQEFSVFLVPQEIPLQIGQAHTIKSFIYYFHPNLKRIQDELDQVNSSIEHSSEAQNLDALIEKQKVLLDEFEHLQGWDLTQNYESYLKFFGIEQFTTQISQLSGGEQKKVLLALGLSAPQSLILWDEPTNHLDMETIRLLEDELVQSSKTFVLISHDRYLLSKVTSRIWHIQRGKIENFNGSYPDYLEHLTQSEHARQKLLERLKNSLKREDDWMKQGVKARRTRSKKRVENFQLLKEKVGHIKGEAKRTLELSLANSTKKTKQLIEAKDISFGYQEHLLFNNISFSIQKGDKIGLLGKNGVGKSTLMGIILNQLKPSSGNLKRAEDIVIQHFSQSRDSLKPDMTPYELLGNGHDFVFLPDGRKRHINAYFESFLFNKDQIHRPLKTFSGGEKNRLQMALNLISAGDLWIFDEPTNDLDLETLNILETQLAEFKGSLILISHDRAFLSTVTNKIWLLANQKLEQFEGGYSQVEAYLEVQAIEEWVDENTEGPSVDVKATPVPVKPDKKISNKEKELLKKLPHKIAQSEKKLDQLQLEIKQFDFSNTDPKSQQLYQELNQSKEKLEEQLLEMYDQLENI